MWLLLPGLWSSICEWLSSPSGGQCSLSLLGLLGLTVQCMVAVQEFRDSARLSHDWMLIDALFRSLLQVSLNRSLGRPLDLEPPESSRDGADSGARRPRGVYSHILAIWVCATGKGMVFKPFSLV